MTENSENKAFKDKIAKLCLSHFDSLPKTGKPNNIEWTILSCIIQEDEKNNLEVVASGTGSKCIGQDKMSLHGDILNDSHAEIICRRAFIQYLYEAMNSSDVMKFNSETRQFEIKKCIKFHFFTTHVPCGDAAIFPKQNCEDFGASLGRNDIKGPPEAKKLKIDNEDIFRTGAKCLEAAPNKDRRLSGSDYHIVGVVRTKPGRGVQTLSVSCSDKIAKWCHLGVQGALLSILLSEPIYLSSFTVGGGTPFDEQALDRAFYGRLKLPQDQQNKMKIGQSNLVFKFRKSDDRMPCSCSICYWAKPSGKCKKIIEVAVEGRKQGVTRKQLLKDGGQLKLCKKEFFKRFSQIIEDFKVKVSDDIDNLSYGEVKKLAKDYQKIWSNLKLEHFKVWPQKDPSLLDFKTN